MLEYILKVRISNPAVDGEDSLAVGIAFMIFCQNFRSAIFVVVGEVIFTQRLVEEIKAHTPSVSIEAALAIGASSSAVRALVPAGSPKLAGVLFDLLEQS